MFSENNLTDFKKQQKDLLVWHDALMKQAKNLDDKKDPNIYWTVKQTLDAAEKELKSNTPSVEELNKAKEKLNWVRSYLMPFENNTTSYSFSTTQAGELSALRLSLKNKYKALFE